MLQTSGQSLHSVRESPRPACILYGSESPIHLLHQVTQLTGFSDPVYAEAYVNVNQYDIVLDVLIVNQTRDTLQACTLELATLGDLKLVEKPQVGL